MLKLSSLFIGCSLLLACNDKPSETAGSARDSSMTTKPAVMAQSEFGDPKYVEMGKKQMSLLSSGDVDAWVNDFADNAVYRWSSGDSLSGKAAITTYWKQRRGKVIDSLSYSKDIWLSLKVNTPQQGPDRVGNWLLGWYQVDVKYKNGKRLAFWIHTDYHYNDADKIDEAIQYMDRAPINKALAIK